MEEAKELEKKRIKYGDFVFYVEQTGNQKVKIDCEHRLSYEKFSSGEVQLQKVNPETIAVALEKSFKSISCDVVQADAKLVLTVKVVHEFLPLIQEQVELPLVCAAEGDPDILALKRINAELDEIKEDVKALKISSNNKKNLQQSYSVSTNKEKVASVDIPSEGDYVLQISYVSKSTSAEPSYTVSGQFVEDEKDQPFFTENIYSQFSYTGYSTFQTFSIILPKVTQVQKTLNVFLTATSQIQLTNFSAQVIAA